MSWISTLSHIGAGVALAAGAALTTWALTKSISDAVVSASTAFFIGLHQNINFSMIRSDISDLCSITQSVQSAQQAQSQQSVTQTKPVQSDAVMAQAQQATGSASSQASQSGSTGAQAQPKITLSAIPSIYGTQVGQAVTVTAANSAYQDFGNGEQVPDAHAGDIARKTSLNWYVVDTPKGPVYTKTNPLADDSYYMISG